jgi:tetratricopeptide (TPR) repeat protein
MKSVLFIGLSMGFLIGASVCAIGQDLGSSNKLFGAPKAAAPKKAVVKKTTPKRNASAAKARPTPTRKRPHDSTTAARITRPAAKKEIIAPLPKIQAKSKAPTPPKKTEIRPSALPERNVPVNAAAAELYEQLIEDGNAARDQRDYASAETAYARAKAIKPRDPRAVYGLGNLYSDQQRWDEAETAYRSALQLDPESAIVRIALSYVLSQPIFVENLSDRYEESEKLARRAIELAPSNALAYDQLGVSRELRGLIGRETEDAYRNAIRLDPAFAPPYAHLGRLLRRRGQVKESDAAYQNALRYSAEVSTMVLVAEVMQSEQRFAESEPLLQKAVKEDPRNPAALLLLGRALTTMGKYPDAERVLRRSLDVDPNGFMANLLLGSLYARQAKYEQAEIALLQALRFVSENEKRDLSQHFEIVGDGYMKNGNARNAERVYRRALSLDAGKESLAAKLARAQHG